jgi:hypothetical protein
VFRPDRLVDAATIIGEGEGDNETEYAQPRPSPGAAPTSTL